MVYGYYDSYLKESAGGDDKLLDQSVVSQINQSILITFFFH